MSMRPTETVPSTWRDQAAAWAFVALGLGASNGAQAVEPCDASRAKSDSSFEITCGGKSECTPASVLDLKPIAGRSAVALTSVCLIGGRSQDTTFSEQIYRYQVDKAAAGAAAPVGAAIAHSLSGGVAAWLRDEAKRVIMQAEAKLPLTVVIVDANDARFKADLTLDMSGSWASGDLRPMITKVECEPCRVGGDVVLTVPNLAAWKAGAKSDPAKLSLMLDGVKLPQVTPSVNASDGVLRYPLLRFADQEESTGAWSKFLPKVLGKEGRFDVGLADDKGAIVESRNAATFKGSSNRLGITLGAAIAVIIALYAYGRTSNWKLLRDDYAIPNVAAATSTNVPMPFSLARSQMLWWTVVVVISWFAIGASAGDWFTITNTALLLMGLGAGTTLGSMAGGVPKNLQKAMDDYNAAVAAVPPNAAATTAALGALKNMVASKRWWNDIASNYGEEGTSGLHRVQMVLFAAIFGAWAVWRAYGDGAIPDLSTAQLALLGISATSYVGFKLIPTA